MTAGDSHTELTPESCLELSAQDLLALIEASSFYPDLLVLASLRDRAASALLSDPSFSWRVSTALQKAFRRVKSSVGDEGGAHVWRCRAEAALFSGRLKQAKDAYDRACEAAKRAKRPGLHGQILVGRIHLLSLLGESDAADRLAIEANDLLLGVGDNVYLGKLHMNQGNAFYQRDMYAEALESYAKASEVFASLGLQDATWVSLVMNQAIACTNLSRIGKAEELFETVLAACAEQGLDTLLAHVRFNLAFLKALGGDDSRALRLLEQAEGEFAAQDLPDMLAASQRSRAEIFLELGLASEAHDLARRAMAGFAAAGMELDRYLSGLVAGQCLIELGRWQEAELALTEPIRFFSRKRIRPRFAQAQLLLAECALGRKDIAAAKKLGRLALRVFKSLDMKRQATRARLVLAETLLTDRRAAEAAGILSPALTGTGRDSSGPGVELLELAGRIASARGLRREAGRFFRRAGKKLEARRELIPGAELRARAFNRQSRVYESLIAWTLDGPSPRFDRLFELSESIRARGFVERQASQGDEGRQGFRAAELRESRARLGSLTWRLEDAEFGGLARSEPRVFAEIKRDLRREERRILAAVRRSEGLSATGTRHDELPDPKRIASLLAGDEVLIEYLVAGDSILVFLIGGGTRRMLTLSRAGSEVQRLVERFSLQLDTLVECGGAVPGDGGFQRRAADSLLRDLHDALFGPLMKHLPGSGRLVLAPHSFLHAVPFECLRDERGYLDERYSFLRVPRADFLLRRRRPGPAKGARNLVAGTVTGGPPLVREELRTVAKLIAGDGDLDLLEDAGSRELMDRICSARIVHLSMHGVFRADNPMFSRLSTRDGGVFLEDLAGGRLSADLVVLSACESGRVSGGAGDDLAGVAHGFLIAGARNLVASRWRVHDQATLQFMQVFYRSYFSDDSRDITRALAGAARELRADWPHPFFWGGFSVFGA